MATVQTTVRKFNSVHPKTRISRRFGKFLDRTSGYSIKLSRRYGATVLIDRRLTHGKPESLETFISRPRTLARVLPCTGRPWEVKTEPLGPKTFGIIVYTSRGKAIAAGTGRVLARGEVRYAVETLYDNITNKVKITFSAEGKIKTDVNGNETYEGTVGVKAEY